LVAFIVFYFYIANLFANLHWAKDSELIFRYLSLLSPDTGC